MHYSWAFEPYFVAKAPLPSTTPPPTWAVFDDDWRNTWFDKCAFFLATAGAGTHSLHLLPHVFYLNYHLGESTDTAPRSATDTAKKGSSFYRLDAIKKSMGLHCPDLCPCVPQELVNVIPEQGFHYRTEEPMD